jgi:hypothetical protein
MKSRFIFSFLFLSAMIVLFTSCKSSRVWETKERNDRTVRNEPPPPAPSPRYYSSTRLIISPTPGFTMNRFHDGRYFHRSPSGLLYWKGYDNRFFLDRNYLNRISYSKWEYDEWRRYTRSSNNSNRR